MTKHQSSAEIKEGIELELIEPAQQHEVKRLTIDTLGSPIENNSNIVHHLNKIEGQLEKITESIAELQVNVGGANSAIRYIQKDIRQLNIDTIPKISMQTEGNRTHIYNTDARLTTIEEKIDIILKLVGAKEETKGK